MFDTNVVTMETVTDFIFLGSKITADDDCSHEIKTLAPWKKSYDQLRHESQNGGHVAAEDVPAFNGLLLADFAE